MDKRRKWIAVLLEEGLRLGVLSPADVLRHMTPAVLATDLPSALVASILQAGLDASGFEPDTVVNTLGAEALAEHLPVPLLWACLNEAAGVIIKEGATVRGLTTAASLWAVAGLGMAFGMGHFVLGAFSTVLVIGSLIFLKKLDPFIRKDRYLTFTVTAKYRENFNDDLEQLVEDMGLVITDISSQVDFEQDEIFFRLVVTQQRKRIGRELTAAVSKFEGVRKIYYN